ncbi:MAG: HlyD family efflux transporter periplasmic adaptor subunit [Burkholderiaceae bacterium]
MPGDDDKKQTTPAATVSRAHAWFSSHRTWALAGVLILVVLVGGFFLERWSKTSEKNQNRIILYGNVDLRQVDLAFNNSERILEVLVAEGSKVTRGQVVARSDTSRLMPQVAAARALVAAQQAIVDKLHRGSRPQEIAQAGANVAAAQANEINAHQQWARLAALVNETSGRAISEQDLEAAKAAMDSGHAQLEVAQKALELSRIGPRSEDIAQGEAQLRANQSQLDLLLQQLADSELTAPSDAIVRSRLLEPGEMASPQRPVLDLALIDPKWVRAYVSESDLGKIRSGMRASITTDSFPNRSISGWIGFISPVAEFTPKSVETVDLRPSLVFEVRVFVEDPADELRLGTPATVLVELPPIARTES